MKTPLSPRRRRLRVTITILSTLVVLASIAGAFIYRSARPQQYRPDEPSQDITSSLARQLPPDAPKPAFTDVTSSAGLGGFRTFLGARTSQLPEDMGPGVAWGDFDNDGDDDLFLVSAGGPLGTPRTALAASELYVNAGNGTFEKAPNFPETRIHGMAAAWGDYDGDGYLDLVVSGYQALLLFHNEKGTGHFTSDPSLPNLPSFWSGASWGDYDKDGRLDLYVCGYVEYSSSEGDRERSSMQLGAAVPFTLNPAAYPGGSNLLFHNNSDGTFTDRSGELKVRNPEGRSLGALWHDFDDDGWLDLYVANDISDNVFFHNQRGSFEDISHPALVADYRSAMGLAVGDYNRDGDDDLFITHWIAQENGLYDNLLSDLQRNSKQAGSRTNASNGSPALRFMDIADQKGLGQMSLHAVGWGTEFVDFDADGWLDLIVANGNTLEHAGPRPRTLKAQEPYLLWNRRGAHFHDLAPHCPPLASQHNSRGLAVSDYDNDGDMDVLIAHLGEGVQLLRNEMQSGHWLQVRLRSRLCPEAPLGFGDGTKVIAHAGGVALRRTVSSVSYLSQSSRTLHFGLGAASQVDRLEVRWHAGETNIYENLKAGCLYEITQNNSAPVKVPRRITLPPSDGTIVKLDKDRLLKFWSAQRAAMHAMKVGKDNATAIRSFREALAIDSRHEDSRYYLGLCLASTGDVEGALEQLAALQQINPQSHRAWQQWGVIRASFANSASDLDVAEESLERAHAINPEETGALLVLGEIALLRGDLPKAERRLMDACHTNPKAVGGFFLRGYIAWERGDDRTAFQSLESTRAALGKDWQPRGATSEGDVREKQHVEKTPLARFWEDWDGTAAPDRVYRPLQAFLTNSERAKRVSGSSSLK